MKNQYSFRLTTTLLPTDTTAKTTDVINKVDANGDKFKPTFTEETVVITNDDRTIIETTRATCTNGVLSFTKRGLSDDNTETSIANRKLTWNPGSLCFVTAGAGDRIDPDDDIVWAGKQTYAGDMESRGKATYKGRLITEKGVEYPHFDTFADLEAYSSPFGGMFAVVDSSGELYRYNAVSEEWSVVTTATPVLPEQADDETIGSVRVATDAEFTAGTDTGSQGEYLMPTVSQVKSNTPPEMVKFFEINNDTQLTVAQQVVDFFVAGGLPIVKTKHGADHYRYCYMTRRTIYFLNFYAVGDADGVYVQIKTANGDNTATNIYFNA